MELKSNHEICLELLDKFLEIAEKHKIEYYMAFGSCLGAVRHQGFIPWDINIDILLKHNRQISVGILFYIGIMSTRVYERSRHPRFC